MNPMRQNASLISLIDLFLLMDLSCRKCFVWLSKAVECVIIPLKKLSLVKKIDFDNKSLPSLGPTFFSSYMSGLKNVLSIEWLANIMCFLEAKSGGESHHV